MAVGTGKLWLLAVVGLSGCLGRGQTDLLQARLRAQQEQLAEARSQTEKVRETLAAAEREAEELRTALAQADGDGKPVAYTGVSPVAAIKINSMLTAGIDQDQRAGDEALVVNFAPYDDDGELVKLHGPVDIVAIDPTQPEGSQFVAKWSFTAAEARQHWVRGFLGSGYQFTLPWEAPPQHDELVLHVRPRAPDDREFVATQVVKIQPAVVTAGGKESARTTRRPQLEEMVTPAEIPPAGRQPLRESTNWTSETMPMRR